VIERLRKEGVIDLNKGLSLPLVPQRIAVISSPTAAGYGDFFSQLDNNPYGYKFVHVLFAAVMQGPETEKSVISCLHEVKNKRDLFDIVVIIRGGGSAADLNWFDSYPLALEIAGFPLPVITGIGHEKDDTVADIVAHTKMKTPTAVAEFLIACLGNFEVAVTGLHDRMKTFLDRLLKDERHALESFAHRLVLIPLRTTAEHTSRILILRSELKGLIRQQFQKETNTINAMEQAVRHLDPVNILGRGYSITRHKGRIIKDAAFLKKWAVIETRLLSGTVTSIIQDKKEATKGEQRQTDDILPGFD
jgi:exodeoxyribonuclease VII large subunit